MILLTKLYDFFFTIGGRDSAYWQMRILATNQGSMAQAIFKHAKINPVCDTAILIIRGVSALGFAVCILLLVLDMFWNFISDNAYTEMTLAIAISLMACLSMEIVRISLRGSIGNDISSIQQNFTKGTSSVLKYHVAFVHSHLSDSLTKKAREIILFKNRQMVFEQAQKEALFPHECIKDETGDAIKEACEQVLHGRRLELTGLHVLFFKYGLVREKNVGAYYDRAQDDLKEQSS